MNLNCRLLCALACATVASAFLDPIKYQFRQPGPLDSTFASRTLPLLCYAMPF